MRYASRRPSVALFVLVAATAGAAAAQQTPLDADDIAGVVRSAAGPEAGVWVIAETKDLPTRFAKIVVTDDAGRYLVPDLPPAKYQLWVRGYGLADSAKVAAAPGERVNLTAVTAPDAATAAKVYPAAYWYSMVRLPRADEVAKLPGGLAEYTMWVKNMGCVGCHQLGQLATRTFPPSLGKFKKSYLHDLSGTDRRNPTVNGYGPLYGSPELSTDDFPILDPRTNTATTFRAPVRDANTPTTKDDPVTQPSPYWGTEHLWDSRANIHNPMLDANGRVWVTARIRAADNPAFCKRGSEHPSAKAFPLERSGRQLAVYEPGTKTYHFVDTCFGTHHLQFASDANDTLWTSGGGPVVGWLDAKQFLATGDAAASQGWSPFVLDTNGNGRRDEWTEPGAPADPKKDTRLPGSFYAVMPNPKDGSIWGSAAFQYPGAVIRFDPKTQLSELYTVPLPGFGVRGADIDSDGVVWVSLGSGHLGEFNRSKCRSPNCPEGWTFHKLPGPSFAARPQESVESSYYTWVDQHDTLGLGRNVPIATGNLFDGVHALTGGRMITLRIPYPLGFYMKGVEGRIDDAKAGWKGRGLWVTSGDRTPWLMETGKGSKPLVVHFQTRPDPLAK